jgi:hypothetical protein
MVALHVWRRLDVPAQESVDDLAKLEQITELAERGCVVDIVIAQRCVGIAPVGPRGRNERSAAVRQDDEHEQHAASLDAADHRQRLALERVALADNGYLIRDIAEMGSLSCLPSMPCPTYGYAASSSTGSRTSASFASLRSGLRSASSRMDA